MPSTPSSHCRPSSRRRCWTTSAGVPHRGGRSVATDGIEGIVVLTENYGATAAFWASLGYVNRFETDHASGQWEHPSGGPYLFIAEEPGETSTFRPIVRVPDAAT